MHYSSVVSLAAIYPLLNVSTHFVKHRQSNHTSSSSSSSSSSSYFGATARCGLWPVEQNLSIFPYLSPVLSIISIPTLEDLFPLLISILSWVFLFISFLPVLE
jgi:hypothetical protein